MRTRFVRSSIDIDAPPSRVWAVLADAPAHATWNPFLVRFGGDLRLGGRLTVRICPPGGRAMTFRPIVTRLLPNRRLEWLGRLLVPGLFDGRHSFTLDPLPGGGTRLIQEESFGGLLVPFSGRLLERTEQGFVAMNEALRRRAEGRDRMEAAPGAR